VKDWLKMGVGLALTGVALNIISVASGWFKK